jgi:hypothetical protein
MSVPHFLYIDDATGPNSDGERYRALLNKEGELRVTLIRPSREAVLVSEAELEDEVDGYILDINLRDLADADGRRFLGTGAGLAQDLRLLQTLGPTEGQRPRPVVRLCAAQVFQDYLAGDDSTVDIFDVGFDKETVGDMPAMARQKLSVLPSIYEAVSKADRASAAGLLSISDEAYLSLHSRFRIALETELTRKSHEAVSFLLRNFLEVPGLLIGEDLLAVRLGVDTGLSFGWPAVRDFFQNAHYLGVGSKAFSRWWAQDVLKHWAKHTATPLVRLTAAERVARLGALGLGELTALKPSEESPGDVPWQISTSEDPALRLPCDLRFSFPIGAQGTAPWVDEYVWCLEQAKRNRSSPQLTHDARARLTIMLQASRTGESS